MKPDESGILKSWSTVVSDAADRQRELFNDMVERIRDAGIPGSSSTGVGKERILCRHDRFGDCQLAIRVWAPGTHVIVSWQLLCRPSWFKRKYTEAVMGDPHALSLPRGADLRQEFTAWTDIVHSCVIAAVKQIDNELKAGPLIRRERADVFDDW